MFTRLADVVSRRPIVVLAFWFVLLIIAVPFAAKAPEKLTASTGNSHNSEAERVSNILRDEFAESPVDRTIVVLESDQSAKEAGFLAEYARLLERLKRIDGVKSVTRFDSGGSLKRVSDDGRITATILETRIDNPNPVIDAIRETLRTDGPADTRSYVTGASAITKDFLERSESDTKRSEFAALPLTAIVLVLAFGALVASGVPLLVGMLSITITMGILFFVAQLTPVAHFAQSVVTMLGLGAGIDYALLIVNRFREELKRGLDPRAAAAQTARTAGRSVAFSGLTVAIAMGALLIPDRPFVRSMGVGGVLVVVVTVFASITAVPAILTLLGERVNWPYAFSKRFNLSAAGGPFWAKFSSRVMRRPWPWVIVLIAGFLFTASPALQMELGYTGAFGLSSNVESRKGLELIKPLELGGSLDTFELVLDLGRERAFDATARSKLRSLDAELTGWPQVRLVVSPFLASREDDASGGLGDLVSLTRRSISENRRYLRLSVIPREPVRAAEIIPWENKLRAAAREAGFDTVILGGSPVGSREFTQSLLNVMPLAIGVVFVATFILLAIAFRSLIIPLKSILMNTLTVGASYGIITLVVGRGWFAPLLGIPTDVGVIDSSLPLIIFAVIFGLSMDYEIFLLSRVQEAHLQGIDTRESVRMAVASTSGVITSAALIMMIVFAAFISGDVVANKTIGLGLSIAVFLDATLVRLILVPAVLVLAGKWNWWLPAGLARLMPRLSLEH